MQPSDWPAAVTWDPTAAPTLGALHGVLARLGGVPLVLVVAGTAARQRGWTARTAIALVDRVASARACVLLDLTFEGGELHPLLQAESVEGVADIFLYGASLRHVVQRPENQRFEFVPAGLPTDSANILTDRRWQRLLDEVQGSGTQLYAYVPADAPGLDALARRIPRFLALAEPGDLQAIATRLGKGADCVAVLSPPQPRPEIPGLVPDADAPAAAHRTSDEDFEAIRVPRQGARETLIADLRAQQRAARMALPPAPVLPDPEVTALPPPPSMPERPLREGVKREPSLTEPTFVSSEPREAVKSRKGLIVALSLAILAALAYGGWSLYQRQQGQAPAGQTQAEPIDPAAPTEGGPIVPLPYSVAIEAHQQLPLALERVGTLQEEEPDMGFYVAPALVDSVLYYGVMAGPVADSAGAAALLDRLLQKGHKTGASQRDVRATPLAFLLGDYDSRAAAETREREAAALSIPAYIIELDPAVGGRRFRVYAGAYSGLAEAEIMRQLLLSVSLPDSLVQRVGTRR